MRQQAAQRYRNRVDAREALEKRRLAYKDLPRDEEDVEDVFHTVTQSDINAARSQAQKKDKNWLKNVIIIQKMSSP